MYLFFVSYQYRVSKDPGKLSNGCWTADLNFNISNANPANLKNKLESSLFLLLDSSCLWL